MLNTSGTTEDRWNKTDVLKGTLDLMVLTTLHAMGPMHGYGLARRIEHVMRCDWGAA